MARRGLRHGRLAGGFVRPVRRQITRGGGQRQQCECEKREPAHGRSWPATRQGRTLEPSGESTLPPVAILSGKRTPSKRNSEQLHDRRREKSRTINAEKRHDQRRRARRIIPVSGSCLSIESFICVYLRRHSVFRV